MSDRPKTHAEILHRLLGSVLLCPHCKQMLKVTIVDTEIHTARDPSGKMNKFVFIRLSDGFGSRFWLDDYPEPKR